MPILEKFWGTQLCKIHQNQLWLVLILNEWQHFNWSSVSPHATEDVCACARLFSAHSCLLSWWEAELKPWLITSQMLLFCHCHAIQIIKKNDQKWSGTWLKCVNGPYMNNPFSTPIDWNTSFTLSQYKLLCYNSVWYYVQMSHFDVKPKVMLKCDRIFISMTWQQYAFI